MKIKTLIIDDEPIALEKLKNYVEKTPFLELVSACSNGMDAAVVISESQVDAIFTDIEMPDLTGLDMIASLTNPPLVVFITAYADYAVESYKLSAVDYLLKPYGFADFQRAANKVKQQFILRESSSSKSVERTDNGPLFVKTDYRYIKVDQPQIIYIKGFGEYLQIFVENETEPLVTLSSFQAIKQSLSSNFIQVHRSYIINMNHVSQIIRGHIKMDDNTEIPIGDSFKDSLNNYLQTHTVGNSNKKS